mmetsp:Transcript_99736/g.157870  ORF Transcript_99736/g.157870 Transcript_99736/m.157870 type:complete len:182 (-) Transcript_99736:168-713(-)
MGASCCKCDHKSATDTNEEQLSDGLNPKEGQKDVRFRRTVMESTIDVNDEDRKGVADPDLEKLKDEAAKRQAAKKRPSITENTPEEIERSAPAVADSGGAVASKRSKGRKGTGFVFKNAVPSTGDDDEEEEEEEKGEKVKIAPAPKRELKEGESRCKGRKGTGFVKKGVLPVDDDEDEDDE